MPYGFFHYPLPGYLPGYPVVVDTAASAKRAAQLVQYLMDGGLLDNLVTLAMSAQVRLGHGICSRCWRTVIAWGVQRMLGSRNHGAFQG